jgi:uncharacterized repeat protein (TIGR03803 family)
MNSKICSSVGAMSLFAALAMVATIRSAVAQTYTVIHNFTGGQDGKQPVTGLTVDRAGNLYGTAELGGAGGVGTVFKLKRSGTGWTFSTLYSFLGGSDGSEPAGEVVIGPNGSIYGTTGAGGAPACGGYGCGTVFNLLPPAGICKTACCPWTERQLYRFAGSNDGNSPLAVLFAGDVMYGLTYGGGGSGCGGSGCGTVFKVDTVGNETVLHRFDNTDGANPLEGRLTSDGAGFFYGTATFGGASCSVEPYFGCGTVFKMDAAGNLTVLHDFSGPPDGAVPSGYLIRDAAGNLYGGAGGGSGPCYYLDMHQHRHYFGCGTIFKIDTAGQETVFYNFRSIPDGRDPVGDLVADSAGNLYGATFIGGGTACGDQRGCGTVFKLDTAGHETVLHTFAGTDGNYPFAGLALDSNGNLYGTTYAGGTYNLGVVFEITP